MPRQWLFDCRSLTLNIIYTFHIILVATVIFGIINASTIKANSTQATEHTDNKCCSTSNSNITQALEQTNKCHSLPTEDIWNPTCAAPNGHFHPSPHSFGNYSTVATPRAITGTPLEWNNINKELNPARHLGISSSEIDIKCWLMHLVVSEADLRDSPIIQCSMFDVINIWDSKGKYMDLCLSLEGWRRWVPSAVETFSSPIDYPAIKKFLERSKLLSDCDREDTTEL
jgi:hypothetical protein